MQFNVAQLLKEPVGASRRYEIDEAGVDLAYINPDAHLTGEARLTRIPDGVLVAARLVTSAPTVCVRCLVQIDEPLEAHFEEEFFQMVDVHTGRSLHPELPPGASLIGDDHSLDLSDVARQELQLAMQMHPLCSAACRGLCPECGANLNDGPCPCPDGPVDSPFAVLRDLHLN